MFIEERHQQILDLLQKKKSITVNELSSTLYVSNATIRRDLAAMERTGLIRRSHGGAVLCDSTGDETALLFEGQENLTQKRSIAHLALQFIAPNSTLFMDSSSSVGLVIPMLDNHRFLSVITNGLKNALLLTQKTSAKIYLTGGSINNGSNSILGSEAVTFLSRLHADVALFSCDGITCENGVTDVSFEQSNLKRQMIRNAKTKVLLCDSSKFDQVFLCSTCGLEDVDYLITDKKPSRKFIEQASRCGCNVIFKK